MLITATKEKGQTRYSLVIDDTECSLINFVDGDRELIQQSSKSPLVSEKLVGLALIAKRIEEGRHISKVLQAASVPPSEPSNNGHN